MEWCEKADHGLLQPDVTFFFDLLPEQAAARADYGNERFEKLAFQTKVYQSYAMIQDASWKVGFDMEIFFTVVACFFLDHVREWMRLAS